MKNLIIALAVVTGVTSSAVADPTAIRNAHELYFGLATATGVSPGEPEVAAFFATILGRLPKAGVVEEATPPMQFAFTNLAGLFCTKCIRQESREMYPDRRLGHNLARWGSPQAPRRRSSAVTSASTARAARCPGRTKPSASTCSRKPTRPAQ